MVFLYQSNRLELLFTQAQTILSTPPDDPLTADLVVVHNPGMAQWLVRQLAFAEGIAAHIRFPLPARFAWDMLQRLTPAAMEEDLFRTPVLRWRIAALLPKLLQQPEFQELRAYCQEDPDGVKLDQLAGKITDIFDQYMVYRPDLLAGWCQGQERHWQASLWQALTAAGLPHRAGLGQAFRRGLARTEATAAPLPQRCLLFGINTLAPVYLDILSQLSQRVELHLFHLSPCRHFWGDLRSARQMAGLRARSRHPADTLYVDQGHPLLMSLGQTGQDFFRQLLEIDMQEIDLYQRIDGHSLLTCLHNDILDLEDRSLPGAARFVLTRDDRSVQLHCCCSALREIQVLHDRLLDLLGRLPDLTPGDILVCAPDIRLYAEALTGVFDAASPEIRIPWAIADHPLTSEQPLSRCLLELLALLPGRWPASDVLALCEHPLLLRRFGLTPDILPRLQVWVRDSGICWGMDQAHRRDLGVPIDGQHSWQFGQDRLLLGYLMGDSRELQAGCLPYGPLGGGDADDLGGFLALLDFLGRWRTRLAGPRPMVQWCEALLALIAELCPAGVDDLVDAPTLREGVAALKADCTLAGHDSPLTSAVFLAQVRELCSRPSSSQPFLRGRVTFCNMVPMRSVPFRVICLLGMNDQDFPRQQPALPFDLIAAQPRLGDRNRRLDDRYLFLEALLSARDVLYLSWVGRNQRDDTLLPPSAVVCELREYLTQSCQLPDGTTVADHLTTIHPLQPFSRRCFDGTPTTASYNRAWLPSPRTAPAPPFVQAPLPCPPEAQQCLDLDTLVAFWRHPVRGFLEQTLGLRLRQEPDQGADSEPFTLDPLQDYVLRQKTVTELLDGQPVEQIQQELIGGGELPHHGFGRLAFDRIAQVSHSFAKELRPRLGGPRPPLAVDLALGPYRLTGWLPNCQACGRVTWRTGPRKGTDLMALWLGHLVLNLQAPADLPRRSVHLFRDSARPEPSVGYLTLGPLDDAQQHLHQLLDLYWQGLRHPLPFFPETSLAWAQAVHQGKTPDKAARAAWEGSSYQRERTRPQGEGQDLAHLLCFPLERFEPWPEFMELSALYLQILDHLEQPDAAA